MKVDAVVQFVADQYPLDADGQAVYFDNAARSIQPKDVEFAGISSIQLKSKPWMGLKGSSNEDVQEMRNLFSCLLNSDDENDVALCPSTAFAMSMAAANVVRTGKLRENSQILILEKEMASAVFPWQEACIKVGASLKVVPTPDWSAGPSASWATNIIANIDDRVAVLALPNVHWCDGTLVDLEAISIYIHQHFSDVDRPLLIIDGTQSIGALPFDVQKIRPDFLACSVHKWLLSPYGTSLVYVAKDHQQHWLPLDQHERAREGSDQAPWDEEIFMTGRGYPDQFFPGARRLDAGGRANPIFVPMIRKALQLVHQLTVPTIAERLRAYCNMLEHKLGQYEEASSVFTSADSSQRGHFFGLRFHQLSLLQAVHTTLKEHHMHCCIRGFRLRISPYLPNTISDANVFQALFFQALREHYRPEGSSPDRLRILITGVGGWLAQVVFHQLLTKYSCRNLFDIYGTYRDSNKAPNWLLRSRQVQMDLASPESVRSAIDSVRPHIILHLAAMSSPVECHRNPALAYQINAPSHLIEAVQEYVPQTLFVFASTDMVYDGESAPYRADTLEDPRPVNIYGASKRAMEKMVLTLPNGVVLRLSNMIGPSHVYRPAGEKFLQFLYKNYQGRTAIGLKTDEMRSFVNVDDVVDVIERLINLYLKYADGVGKQFVPEACRVLNIGGPTALSRMDLAHILARHHRCELVIQSSAEAAKDLMSQDTQDKAGEEKTWVVYVWPASPAPAMLSSAPLESEPLRSPRNIAMQIEQTEQVLGMKFTTIEEVVGQFLHVR